MSKVYLHEEVVEGVTRVQTGPIGEVLQRDAAVCIARALIALANGGACGLGQVLFDCPASQIRGLERRFEDLKVHVVTRTGGAVARALGFDSRRVQISEVPFVRLAEVLELCWEHAPLLFGVPVTPSHVVGAPPDLSRTVTPSVEYLMQWRALGAVVYHGE